MSNSDLSEETLKKIRDNEISKCESLSDRLIQYIDVSRHTELVTSSISESLEILNCLDRITSFSNKHETQINYGNIVEDFILNNSSLYNGKILNYIFENNNNEIQNFYIKNTGGSDKRLLDKQEKITSSI